MSNCLRGECKEPGGKLIAVTVSLIRERGGGTRIGKCWIDGDFFIDSSSTLPGRHSLLSDLESAIEGMILPLDRALALRTLDMVMSRNKVEHVVGASSRSLAGALVRALPPELLLPPQNLDLDQQSGGVRGVGSFDLTDGIRRWGALDLTLIRDSSRGPVEQMALDQALAESVAEGRQPPTLRIWKWGAPAVILGRFQSIDQEVRQDQARKLGFTVVRRCTGGGTMFVEPDKVITYSLYLPANSTRGLDLMSSYRLCDLWLVLALRASGIQASWSGINDIASEQGKIGGAAQRHFPGGEGDPGGILHHVTLAYQINAEKMIQVLKTSDEKLSDKAVKSARSRIDPLCRQTDLNRDELVDFLLDTLTDLADNVRQDSISQDQKDRADQLVQERYSQPGWTEQLNL